MGEGRGVAKSPDYSLEYEKDSIFKLKCSYYNNDNKKFRLLLQNCDTLKFDIEYDISLRKKIKQKMQSCIYGKLNSRYEDIDIKIYA